MPATEQREKEQILFEVYSAIRAALRSSNIDREEVDEIIRDAYDVHSREEAPV